MPEDLAEQDIMRAFYLDFILMQKSKIKIVKKGENLRKENSYFMRDVLDVTLWRGLYIFTFSLPKK